MANNQKNVQPKVVTTTTTVSNRRRGRRRRRTPRSSAPSTTTVRKVSVVRQPRRPPRRRFNRPGTNPQSSSSMFTQKITATLGTVGANSGDKIELEMSALINPALMRESTGSNAYGPIQMYAANYNLWRIRHMTLRLNPLVGGSAVSGTAIRASLNLSGQPGSPNWSALGARFHKDTTPGRPLVMRIPGSRLLGPKEGWFLCNTKNDPQLCIGGSLEIHSYGKTMSTYQSTDYTGPLFLAELEAVWQFKNYNPEPGMLNLVKMDIKEDPQRVKIHSNPGEPIVMSIPSDSSMSRAILQTDVAADASPSELIWQICDAAIDAATPVFPPPFSWLFKCGWWFIKRIANKNQNINDVQGQPNPGELTFQVFQSISDAQNGVPCISNGTTSTVITNINELQLTQITPGNTGIQQETLAGLRRIAPATGDPVQISSPSLFGQPALSGHIYANNKVPVNSLVMQAIDTQKKVYSYSVRHLLNPEFTQNGNLIQPDEIDLPSYPIKYKEGASYGDLGKVYLASFFQTAESPKIHWTTCCWKATTTRDVKLQGGGDNNRNDKFLFFSPRQSQTNPNLPTTTYYLQVSGATSLAQTTYRVEKDQWYLSTFVAAGNSRQEFANYGVPYYLSQVFEVDEGNYEPTQVAYNVGAMMNTATPLILNPNTNNTQSLTVSELVQLRQLLTGAVVSEPPDLPSIEEEEEEELQGAVGGVARERTPTPYPEEEEEDEDESDLDDEDYSEVPFVIRNLLTPKAKTLLNDLQRMGLSHDKAVRAAQGAYPHPAIDLWDAA